MGPFGRKRRETTEAELAAYLEEIAPLVTAGRLGTTQAELRRALDRAQPVLGQDHRTTMLLRLHCARLLISIGRPQEAAAEANQVLLTCGRNYRDQLVRKACYLYAWALGNDGRHRESAWELRRLYTVDHLTQLCFAEQFDEAESASRRVLADAAGLPKIRWPVLTNLAMALIGLGRPAEAEQIARDALSQARSADSPIPATLIALGVNLSLALSAQGRHIEALDAVAEAEAISNQSSSSLSAIAKARARAGGRGRGCGADRA